MLCHAYVRQDAEKSRSLEEISDSIDPVDWAAVVRDLGKAGISARKVALILNVGNSTVNDWMTGSVPNADAGRKLLAIWSKVTGIPEYRPPTKRPN